MTDWTRDACGEPWPNPHQATAVPVCQLRRSHDDDHNAMFRGQSYTLPNDESAARPE